MVVLEILLDLAACENVQALSSAMPIAKSADRSRIDRVLHRLHQHYHGRISIGELAELAALSESGLHRLFTKYTNTTVMTYVIRLRIGDACARLAGTDQPVTHIATDVGYDNLANFNRQFRSITGMTPRQYRASFRA
jgi:AraC-like DNA-binding protein